MQDFQNSCNKNVQIWGMKEEKRTDFMSSFCTIAVYLKKK